MNKINGLTGPNKRGYYSLYANVLPDDAESIGAHLLKIKQLFPECSDMTKAILKSLAVVAESVELHKRVDRALAALAELRDKSLLDDSTDGILRALTGCPTVERWSDETSEEYKKFWDDDDEQPPQT